MTIYVTVVQNPSYGKIQDGDRRHFETTQASISRPILGRFVLNLVCCFILAIRRLLSNQNQDGDGRHPAFVYSAIPRSAMHIFASNLAGI